MHAPKRNPAMVHLLSRNPDGAANVFLVSFMYGKLPQFFHSQLTEIRKYYANWKPPLNEAESEFSRVMYVRTCSMLMRSLRPTVINEPVLAALVGKFVQKERNSDKGLPASADEIQETCRMLGMAINYLEKTYLLG